MTQTTVFRTPLDAAQIQLQGLARLPFEKGLFRTTSSSAMAESQSVEPPAAFDDLVGSWNADVPAGAMLELQAQVRVDGRWSGWYTLAAHKGKDEFYSVERQENDDGYVDVDTLKLKKKASAYRWRLLLSAPRKPIFVRRVAVAVSDDAMPVLPPAASTGPWTRELKVKPRSQMEEQEKYKHDICSPTSLSMALEFWGKKLSTIDVAEKVRDRQTQIFGHWPFNAAFAGSMGLEAHVARLDGLAGLQDEIARGRPVVTSLTFGLGELSGSPLKKTKGHLVLVVGFSPRGEVIVLDPAAPNRGSARRVYDRLEFHKAWAINKRGLAYVLGPLAGSPVATGVPVADLREKPKTAKKVLLDDPERLSQLLYGERATILAAKGNWARVRADEQPASGKRGAWGGYEGWVPADALTSALPGAADVVVRTRQTLAQRGQDMVSFSVGTRLERLGEAKGVSHVRLLDGSAAEIPSDALIPRSVAEPGPETRALIVKTAELFLGTSYYWGGRSGVQPELSIGVDCSGLVSLAYRVQGLDIPRDSHDQYLGARALASRELEPGDLVFLTEPGRPKRVTHVMIYTGGDGLIESRKSSGRVLRSSFRERFGKPLAEIEAGQELVDYSFPTPKKRRIWLGSYLPK